jgi:hypothetical protein
MPIKKSILVRRASIIHLLDRAPVEFAETDSWIHFRNKDDLVISVRRFLEKYNSLDDVFKVKGRKTVLPKNIKDACEYAEIDSRQNAENVVVVQMRPGKLRVVGESDSGQSFKINWTKYKGPPVEFGVVPDLLIKMVEQNPECEITPHRLKIETGTNFIYVTALNVIVRDDDKPKKKLKVKRKKR